MLRSNDLSAEQRKAMSAHVLELRNKLDSIESQINPSEIAARREFLQKNKGMHDIFNTFWVTLLAYTTDGFLSKEGYTKFHHAIEIALAGQPTFADVDQAAVDADWTYDKLLYGNLNKPAFFDMLFEIIGKRIRTRATTYSIVISDVLQRRNVDGDRGPHVLRGVRVGAAGQHRRYQRPATKVATAQRDAVHHKSAERGGKTLIVILCV
jgi:hypothetical protein